MDILFFIFAGATGIAAALASIAIWAPRPTRVRLVALTITLLFLPVVYVQLIEMLSRPKPMSFEWYQRNEAKAELLGISLDEGQSIYLWLRFLINTRKSVFSHRSLSGHGPFIITINR